MNDQERISEAAGVLGRLGGAKGGHARAASLTPERRSEIARTAAAVRWSARSGGRTLRCPICGKPYKFRAHTVADQSACPACVREAEENTRAAD